MNPFGARWGSSRPDSDWFSVGLVSSFPDTGDDKSLSQFRSSNGDQKPGCKAFYAPRGDSTRTEVAVGDDALEASEAGGELKDQVLVFRYKGKFHAVDHRCPHASFPLSNGVPFDIEDFGIVLSAGLTCPKHGWAFDMYTGMSDRARYKLGVWEVEVRDVKRTEVPASQGEDGTSVEDGDKEVWRAWSPFTW
ncbi:uncharacterized protein DNG_00170 [Cephalotrichum gorgonifer]|uniref:Rieske domain-containing protein n=1 Tax=Cephalotrichum gorgonifer TaxID=2041049 RepID=A0AAE8SQX9_9PEZI|nr:uncharacterized protein DNG_00170 [Cephalotrichum gorgonifer]